MKRRRIGSQQEERLLELALACSVARQAWHDSNNAANAVVKEVRAGRVAMEELVRANMANSELLAAYDRAKTALAMHTMVIFGVVAEAVA